MGKLIDLTNKRFGKLIVLEKSKNKINNRPAWICQCDCGQIKEISGKLLREGQTKSCGCLVKEKNSQNGIDFKIGEKINHWTILEKTDERKHGYIYWKCKCDCGNIGIISGHSLRAGDSKSCGKCLRNTCIGEQYNELTIIGLDLEKTTNKNLYVKCKCSCGKIISTQYSGLKQGHSKSCGCKNQSLGAYKIEKLLLLNNLSFEKEKTFSTCKFPDTNYPAFFDFWVENKYIIEFDGKQHFYETNLFSYPLSKIHEHDLYKNNWCKENNIPIIRIPYTYQEKITIEDLLLESSNFLLKG